MRPPLVSVMIPTWRPDPEYLETAVASVLAQFEPGQAVQIELVDDCSPDFDVSAFADRFGTGRPGSGRVSARRNERRLGLVGNWNSCLEHAKHPWVHLLHQDDFVLDGFYAALQGGVGRTPQAALAFSASYFVDGDGLAWAPKLVAQDAPGILEDWMQAVFARLAIQCSATLVRADAVRALGGFDTALAYTPDWDLWQRLAVDFPIWFDPRPLAAFRQHSGSETSRQRASGAHVAEIFQCIERFPARLGPEAVEPVSRTARRHYAAFAVEEAWTVLPTPGGAGRAGGLLKLAWQRTSTLTLAAALCMCLARACVRPLVSRRRPLDLSRTAR
ncbi:glycosyltransferase family 2 protein [Elongatibacter sediminis]|uniref:Glycosyltransferase n=1 Tax=Elongatibacter sediminis TaxID=3119006 RepID=A0AAW9RB29_9GAMM